MDIKDSTKHQRLKIMFLCNFSNSLVRERVTLKTGWARTLFYRLQNKQPYYETDYAIWVSDYIEEFEKHPEFEFHIVAPMQGLNGENQSFEERGIYYHFYNCSYNLVQSMANVLLNMEERCDYVTLRKRISKIRNHINPDLVILCGAENPFYSIGALDVKDKPVYVIPQTLLNTPKRIEMGVGTAYKRHIELAIFRHAGFFCTTGQNTLRVIKEQNKNATFLPAGFPTHRPVVKIPKKKEYDFAFFAKTVAKYKGIEDLFKALHIVTKKFSGVKLIVIGGVAAGYQKELIRMLEGYGLEENVFFAGQYPQLKDTYENVAKAKAVVLPGLTGAFNSTVRESMLMGLPTICYDVAAIEEINIENTCLMTAPMGDIVALSGQMLKVLERPEETNIIALNGRIYADKYFSNSAVVNKLLHNCELILKLK